MVVTLYEPGQPPRNISPEGYALASPDTGFARVTEHIARELDCALGMVDVLDCGPDFVAYTIFDFEGEVNREGTLAIQRSSGHPAAYDASDADDEIRGPVLIVTRQ